MQALPGAGKYWKCKAAEGNNFTDGVNPWSDLTAYRSTVCKQWEWAAFPEIVTKLTLFSHWQASIGLDKYSAHMGLLVPANPEAKPRS